MKGNHFYLLSGLAACAISALAAAPAHADVIATVAIDAGNLATLEVARPPVQARVFVEQPIGTVTAGADPHAQGPARYGVRMGPSESGLVRFSQSRPLAGAAAITGSQPAGLPLASARLTSRFGARRNPVSGTLQHHAGVDLAAPAGSPVVATGDGVVAFAGAAGNYGLLVVLDHGNGLQTRYAHLSRLGVSRGQGISAGDIVGLVGSTGRSTGPHLHYEVRTQGQAVNPLGG